ncbi:MAG: acetyl esterase/lipase [Alphaproteobacteria bacterium]|jgi:acetyl esterase/lipase
MTQQNKLSSWFLTNKAFSAQLFCPNQYKPSWQWQNLRSIGLSILMVFFLQATALSNAANAKAESSLDYLKVPANVPYSEVAKLSAISHTKTISYGESPEQKIYYWSANGVKKNNVIVFIHGGCWLEGYDIKHSLPFTSALSLHGFDVYSIEYRRTGNGGEWPVALNDIELALQAIELQLLSANMSVDAAVSIIGHSAGGHLATLAVMNATNDKTANSASETTLSNLHLFGLAPIIDLAAYANGNNDCQTATPAFMGGTPSDKPEAYKAANPLKYKLIIQNQGVYLSKAILSTSIETEHKLRANNMLGSATMLIGTNDDIVPQSMAQHPDAKFVLANEAGHFDWIHPGSPAFKQLVDKLNVLSSSQ